MKEDFIAIAILAIPVIVLGLFTLFFDKRIRKFNGYFLNFSGAFLLSVLALHIFPEVYESDIPKIGIYVIVGFFIQVLLEYLSQGIEHGHIHEHEHSHGSSAAAKAFPIGILLSLCVHAFIEGLPIEMELHGDFYDHSDHAHAHHHHHHAEGLWSGSPLLLGILIHKIPVAVTLSLLLISKSVKRGKVIFSIILFALMAPLGILVGHMIGHNINADFSYILEICMAVVMGMLLHISSTILFEADESHHKNLTKLGFMVLGALVAYISL